MTSAVALAIPAAAAANATAPTAAAPSSAAPSAFAQPLAQARQQQAANQSAKSQAPAAAPASAPAASSAAVATTKPAATTTATAQAQTQDKDNDGKSPSVSPDAAAAMLALLGQSIPANATPAPVTSGDTPSTASASTAATIATTTVGAQAASGVGLLGAIQSAAKPVVDDMLNVSTAEPADDDASLAATGSDANDTAVPTSTTAAGGFSQLLAAATTGTATATASQGDHHDPLSALQALVAAPLQQAPTQAMAVAPHTLTMQASAGTPAFAQELGQQVAWLGGQDIKQARIRLHPEDLGELDVKVSVQHGSVDVSFIAQHPQAVHAVQQTLSQLDSMLAHHGLSLGQAQVGQGGSGSAQGQAANANGTSGGEAGSGEGSELAAVAAPIVKAVGLLDMFA